MIDRRDCIRCHRVIDAGARICPFCNWDQLETPPAARPVESAPVPTKPPVRERVKRVRSNRSLALAAAGAVLVAAFAVGGLFFAFGPKGETPRPRITAEAGPSGPPTTNASPVPFVTGSAPTSSVTTESPMTTLPANVGMPGATGTTGDATALSSVDYSRMTQTAPPPQYSPVDPRSVATPPPGSDAATAAARRSPFPDTSQQPPAEQPRVAHESKRTNPRPISQPIPNIRNAEGTVRLKLTVTPDGRVSTIDVLQPIHGATDKVIAAVQRWKFQPATVDGQPVEGSFTVEIFFGGNGR